MDAYSKLRGIVLSVLGKKEFEMDKEGHLVLSPEEAEILNGKMKYAGADFSNQFKESFDALADANTGGDAEKQELITNAFIDVIRKGVMSEISDNKTEIEKGMNQELVALKAESATLKTREQELVDKTAELERKNEILAAKTEPLTPEAIVLAAAAEKGGRKFKPDMKHFHNKMAFDFINGDSAAAIVARMNNSFSNKTMGGGPTSTIDVSELNEEFGAYLSDNTTRFLIYKDLLRATESRNYMTKVLAINEWHDAQMRIGSVSQQFIAKWTPLGKVAVTPLKIVNRRHKINLPIVPDDITGGYLTYLYNEAVTPDQMPDTRYILEQLLRPRISDDIEYVMIASGKFEELVPGDIHEGDAGQDPSKSMDGFLTVLGNEHASPTTKMNFWTPSLAWNEDNSVEYFEAFAKYVKQTNPTLAKVGMNVFCDPDMDETRRRKYREMFPLTKNSDMSQVKIDFSNLTIIPLENMRGSGVIFTTPQENFIELHHMNEASGATNLFLQLQNYEVRVFGEFWLAVGFGIAEWVFAAMPTESGSGI